MHKVFLLLCWGLCGSQLLPAQAIPLSNSDFATGTAGWSAFGNAVLTHVPAGALSAGAARLEVSQSSGYSSAGLQTSVLAVPSSARGAMHLLTVQVRGGGPAPQTFRIRAYLTNSAGQTTEANMDEWLSGAGFEDMAAPVYIAADVVSVQLRFQCGLQSGLYFFDDVYLAPVHTPTQSISQFDHWAPRLFVRPQAVTPQSLSSAAAHAQVVIGSDEVKAAVLPTQFGVNSNFRSGNGLVGRAATYRPFGSFRFPAGSGSNQYFWDCEAPPSFAVPVNDFCGLGSSYLHPENLLSFKNNAQGEATIVVNYMYARYGLTQQGTREARVRQAAEYAAEWVRFFNVEHQAGIRYWEIGNECYGSWETGYDVNGSIITGKEYGEDFRIFAEAMKAVDARIHCGAVLWHKGYAWNNQVLREVKDHADFLIVHHYFEPSNAVEAAEALQEVRNDMQHIQALAARYTGRPAGHFPVAFTEFNIQGSPAATMFNGLFVAEALGAMIESGFFMTNVWVNEWNIDADQHTKGLLAQNDPDQANYTPRPSYTPFYYYDKYFGDRMVACQVTGNNNVRAYASTFSSGETGVALVNYSAQPLRVAFQLPDASAQPDSIFWHSIHADNMNAGNKKFYVNGQTGSTPGGGPVLSNVPAFAAAMNAGQTLQLPPYSATYAVLNTRLATSTGAIDVPVPMHVFPNPTDGFVYWRAENEAEARFDLLDVSGRSMGLPSRGGVVEGGLFRWDCSSLPAGVYFLRAGGRIFKLVRI